MSGIKETLFASSVTSLNSFKFDTAVVNVFPDMIQRSVPGYQTIIHAIGLLAKRYAKEHSVCYDLGCSLGAAAISMRHQISTEHCKIIAVDNSLAMLEQFKKNLKEDQGNISVDVLCADIRDLSIKNASVVVLNFTLQFIPIEDRYAFLKKFIRAYLPGGILILSEKLSFEDEKQQQLQTNLHHLFKNLRAIAIWKSVKNARHWTMYSLQKPLPSTNKDCKPWALIVWKSGFNILILL